MLWFLTTIIVSLLTYYLVKFGDFRSEHYPSLAQYFSVLSTSPLYTVDMIIFLPSEVSLAKCSMQYVDQFFLWILFH